MLLSTRTSTLLQRTFRRPFQRLSGQQEYTLREHASRIYFRLYQGLRRTFIKPVSSFLKQGVTPEKLALTIAVGVIIGMSPMFGTTTVLCVLVALCFRLNIAAIQLAHYIAAPLQIILLVPFIQVGGFVFDADPMPFTFTQVKDMFMTDILVGFKTIRYSLLMGLIGWLLISIPLSAAVYFATLPLLKKFSPSPVNNEEHPIV